MIVPSPDVPFALTVMNPAEAVTHVVTEPNMTRTAALTMTQKVGWTPLAGPALVGEAA